MATSAQIIKRSNHKKLTQPFCSPADLLSLHRVLTRALRALGERMEQTEKGAWEGRSLNGSHVWSRNDLESNGLLIRFVQDFLAREGLDLPLSFESEELSVFPDSSGNGSTLRGIIDPIDGTKAFDNWVCGGDFPLPRPSSAISIAVVCPVLGETVVSALYCFDLAEVFSTVYLGEGQNGEPIYCGFRNDNMIPSYSSEMAHPQIEAKKRVLNCDYNARCQEEIARLSVALMDRKLKAAYGGLAGSSATDIINVVRGSFAACVDVRALCGGGGSVLTIAKYDQLYVTEIDACQFIRCDGTLGLVLPTCGNAQRSPHLLARSGVEPGSKGRYSLAQYQCLALVCFVACKIR